MALSSLLLLCFLTLSVPRWGTSLPMPDADSRDHDDRREKDDRNQDFSDDRSDDQDMDENNGKEDHDEGDDYERKRGNRKNGFQKLNDNGDEYDNEKNNDYHRHRKNDHDEGADDRNHDDNDDWRRKSRREEDDHDIGSRRNDVGDFSDQEDEGHWERKMRGKKVTRGRSKEDEDRSRSDAIKGSQLRSGGMTLSNSNLISFSAAVMFIVHAIFF